MASCSARHSAALAPRNDRSRPSDARCLAAREVASCPAESIPIAAILVVVETADLGTISTSAGAGRSPCTEAGELPSLQQQQLVGLDAAGGLEASQVDAGRQAPARAVKPVPGDALPEARLQRRFDERLHPVACNVVDAERHSAARGEIETHLRGRAERILYVQQRVRWRGHAWRDRAREGETEVVVPGYETVEH